MKLTDQQKSVVESNGDIVVNAVAGSGKTTTLVEYAKSRPTGSRILYLAFNKSVKSEAIKKFSQRGLSNVVVETAHSLAFRAIIVGGGYEVGFTSLTDITILLFNSPSPTKDQLIAATHILKFAALFCNSTATKVSEVDYRTTVDDREELKRIKAQYDMLELNTRQYLAAMHSGKIKISHDFYLKLFQLSNPTLSYDYILFDEAQDASPVMVDIIKKQTQATRVIVGDSHQQIYSWRYAVNSISMFGFRELSLTHSFRFPQYIADLATEIIDTKRHIKKLDRVSIVGAGVNTTKKTKSRAIIGRTNISLLGEAISIVKKSSRSIKIYFEGHINSYLFASDEGSLSDVLNLYNNKRQFIRDPIVSNCDDINELKEYARRIGDSSLSNVIELVNNHGDELPMLIGMLKKRHVDSEERESADYFFSTVHKCKGLEYDEVTLCDDFLSEKEILARKDEDSSRALIEEINLLYVAVTRTKSILRIPSDTIPKNYSGALKGAVQSRKGDASFNLNSKSGTLKFPKKSQTKKGRAYSGTPWSPGDEEYLIRKFNSGETIKSISEHLGRSRSAVRSRLKFLNAFGQ